MAESYVTQVELRTNVEKVLEKLKETQDRMDKLEGKEYKINLGIDAKTLESVIQKLDKMLNSLGKGTGDFKQLESLSKQLESITSDVRDFSKAFGKIDDSGAKTLLSFVQNIDKSLSELSQNILNVNKNMGNMGVNTSGAVKQVENISNAYQNAAKEAEKLADAQSKIGQKTNISSGSTTSVIDNQIKKQNEYNDLVAVGYDRIQKMKKISESGTTGSNSVYDLLRLNHKAWDEVKANNFFNKIPEEGLKRYIKILEVVEKIVQEMVQASGLTEEQIVSQLKNIKTAQGGNFKLNGADSGWTHFATYSNGQKDSMQKVNGITYKVYAAFDDIKDLNQNVVSSIMNELTKAGFKGRLKTTSGSTSFGDKLNGLAITDQMVVHGSTKKDQEIAYNTLKNMGLKLSYLGGGIDTPDGSFSQTLASGEINKYIQGLEKEATVARDTAKAEQQLVDARKESSTASTEQKKDAFQSKNSNQKSQEIKRNLEAVAQSENKARQEAIKTDKAINNINFVPNTEGFDEIVSKFKLLREEAEQIVKITKTTRQAVDGTFSTSYTAKLKNGSTYNLDGNRQSQMSSANEVIYNSAEREKQIWEELSSELNRYATLQKKIARGTALESEKNEANELLKTIRELQRSDILSPEKLNASNKKLSQIRQSFKDIRANVEKNTTKSFQSKIETAISNAQKKYDEYSIAQNREDFNPSTKFETTLSTLGSQINNLKEKAEAFSKTEITTKKQRNEVEELIQKLEETKTSLNNMSAAEKGVDNQSIEKVIDRINKVLKDNTRFSKAAKKELKSLITLAESGSASAKVITTRMLEIKNAEAAAGRAGKSFFDIFKSKTFYGFIGQAQSYLSMYVGFYGMVNAVRNTVATVTELDTALVDLKKTTSMNTSELNQFYFDSNKVAKQMGVTTQEIINQASAWSRLNKIGLLYGDI